MNKLNILFEGSQGVLISISPEQLPGLLLNCQFVKKEYDYELHKYVFTKVDKDTSISIVREKDMPSSPPNGDSR